MGSIIVVTVRPSSAGGKRISTQPIVTASRQTQLPRRLGCSGVLTIDGSMGEGGGQILRTALSASLLTGQPFAMTRIRAGRRRPGLLPQHLAAVRAACEISGAETSGAVLGSESLIFQPGETKPGNYRFSTGTAGSATLVLQTILLSLLEVGDSEVVIEGGTHNEGAPPFEYLDLVFAPLLRLMGASLDLDLQRSGFYPVGGGIVRARTRPTRWKGLALNRRGGVVRTEARALVSRLPISIAERELAVVEKELGWPHDHLCAVPVDSPGPGNILLLVVESAQATEVFTGFGRRGLAAERVAMRAVESARRYLRAEVPVGKHLADQLLLPLTRAGGGSFATTEPTPHFRTNAYVLKRFFDVEIAVAPEGPDRVTVECRTP
jgi:RNA 3'-terminal phosphate cyclase (ATP)